MEFCPTYEKYSNCLVKIIDQLDSESLSQEKVAQSERNAVSTIENQYMTIFDELQQAQKAVQEQYQSVWESCTRDAGIRRPQDQRPAATDLPWKETVRIQEQAASAIRNWFSLRTQQAFIERQKKIREEAVKKAAIAAAQAENEKRKAEEAARAEKERAEALIESMKRKYRGY